MSNQEITTNNQSDQSSQFEIDNRPPSQALTQLNQPLIDHEETVLATSATSSQIFKLAQTSVSLEIPPLSQSLLVHEEAVTTLEINNLELQVTEDMRDLLASFPEGWFPEGDTKMQYHTNEARWGAEGVPENEIE